MVDLCKACEGIWLDAHEYSQIKAAKKSAPPLMAPDELLVCPKCGKEQHHCYELHRYCGLMLCPNIGQRGNK